MPRPKRDARFFELAKRGAETRLRELADEIKSLTSAFPDLRDSFDDDELPVNFILRRGRDQAAGKTTPHRRPMSAARRKAVSERMKKYWAARKKSKE